MAIVNDNEILELVKKGKTVDEIAEALRFSSQTISRHIVNMAINGSVPFEDVIDVRRERIIAKAASMVDDWNGRMKPVMEKLEEQGYDTVSYYEIALTLCDPKTQEYLNRYRSEVYIPYQGTK